MMTRIFVHLRIAFVSALVCAASVGKLDLKCVLAGLAAALLLEGGGEVDVRLT